MVSASGGTTSGCVNEASSFSISSFLGGREIALSQIQTRILDFLQHVAQLAGGAFRSGSRIVEFVRQSCRELSQRGQAGLAVVRGG